MNLKTNGTIRVREIHEVYKLLPKDKSFRARDISMNPRVHRIIAYMASKGIIEVVGKDENSSRTPKYIYMFNPYHQRIGKGRNW